MKNYYTEEVLKLISERILNKSIDELKEIYLKFEKNKNEDCHPLIPLVAVNEIFRKFLEKKEVCQDRPRIQFDLSYFLPCKRQENPKTIIILGMDAKSNYKGKDVLLSTPYNTHDSSPKEYAVIIDKLNKHYNIYLTDLYKGYWVEDKNGITKNEKSRVEDRPSNQNINYIKLEIHKEILEKEINILGENLVGVLAWGAAARNAILDVFSSIKERKSITNENITAPYELEKFKLIATVHPSNLATKWKNKYFENNKLGDKWDPIIMAEAIINAFDVK